MPGYRNFTYGYYPPNIPGKENIPDDYVRSRIILRNGMNKRGNAPETGIVSMPLIIPPIRDKEYDKYGELFKSIWNSAYLSLIETDRIFLIGYSFPPTDTATIELFINAFMNRKKMPEIIVINPFPKDIVEIIKMRFGIADEFIHVDECWHWFS